MAVRTAGIDGCRGGWLVVSEGAALVATSFASALAALGDATLVGLDMPVGLLDEFVPGGRECDRAARRALGQRRASSVFSPPPRAALHARSLAEARASGARLTLQTLNIMAKIREVDEVMSPALQARVTEVHPELAFTVMAGTNRPIASKHTAKGRELRHVLLAEKGLAVPGVPRGATEIDVLDACAASWSAGRAERVTVPHALPLDRRGLRMAISW